MKIAAAVMMMTDRGWTISIPIDARVGLFIGRHMDVSLVVIVMRLNEGDSGPIGGVADRVLRLHHAMQVHGRQEGDTQTDEKVAKGMRQRFRFPWPV